MIKYESLNALASHWLESITGVYSCGGQEPDIWGACDLVGLKESGPKDINKRDLFFMGAQFGMQMAAAIGSDPLGDPREEIEAAGLAMKERFAWIRGAYDDPPAATNAQ